jgi:hypothetical protein
MKFNFGTGIFIFLSLFVIALIAFVIFAHNQDVNLVHDNYYEKGVDHSRQMEKEARSASIASQINVSDMGDVIQISFPEGSSSSFTQGKVVFFRPSDHLKDLTHSLTIQGDTFTCSKDKLIPGRYIVKISWQKDNLDYEVDKSLIVK